ncbi:MAG: carbonic anhydrase [Phycisphaerales bacterium JB038]
MHDINTLLASNETWSRSVVQSNPSFLPSLARGQAPICLWLGCSDSRVPPDTVCGAPPGTLFVHRNIANLAPTDDASFRAVLQYAVAALKVPHIVVCGHSNCGGLTAVVEAAASGDVERWLRPARELYEANRPELDSIADLRGRVNRLAELNVEAQVRAISRTAAAQEAWQCKQELTIHGLMYELATGQLRDLGVSISAAPQPQEAAPKSPTPAEDDLKPKNLW